MNMKFMQRAQDKQTTPQKDSDPRPAKRRRTEEYASTPSGVDSDSSLLPTPTSVDFARDQILERQAEEAGDTKWSLEGQFKVPTTPRSGLRVISAGYGAIDNGAQVGSDDSSEEADNATRSRSLNGRRTFGPVKQEPAVRLLPFIIEITFRRTFSRVRRLDIRIPLCNLSWAKKRDSNTALRLYLNGHF